MSGMKGLPGLYVPPPKPPGPSLTLSSVRPPDGGVYLRLSWPGADAPEILIGLGLTAAACLSNAIAAAVLEQAADILTGKADHAGD